MANSSNVVQFRRGGPRHPDCDRALALIEEANALLINLADKHLIKEGSPPAETITYLENAIGMLSPDEEDDQV